MAVFDWTFDQAFAPNSNWLVDGVVVSKDTTEVSTDRMLSLTFRVSTDVLESTLRPLKSDEAKVDVLGTDDGGFVAVDRANGGNTFTVTPPVPREPLRSEGTFHVERYEETPIEQRAGVWQVEVEFVRDANRTDTQSISESPANGAVFDWTFDQAFGAPEWGFETRFGEIATARVDADVVGTGEGGAERFELTARFTFAQALTFEAALNRLGAGRIKQIPDAPNIALDESSNDVVTVTVDTPDSGTAVSDGDYVVTRWESRRVSDAIQEVEFVIAAT